MLAVRRVSVRVDTRFGRRSSGDLPEYGVWRSSSGTFNSIAIPIACGLLVEQVCTGIACHLNAAMVKLALGRVAPGGVDIRCIESVGNLACPACVDLGQHFNIALLSTPKGDNKPSKRPVTFRAADLVLLTTRDEAPVMFEFDRGQTRKWVRHLRNTATVAGASARVVSGMVDWSDWLAAAIDALRSRVRIMTACGRHQRSISQAGL